RPSRAVLRPCAVSKSATPALMSGFEVVSILAVTSALPPAKLSFRRPHSPLGSAAVTAMPAIITLSRMSFHSSGVKFDLSGMGLLLYLNLVLKSWSARLRLVLHQPLALYRRLLFAAGGSRAGSAPGLGPRGSLVVFCKSPPRGDAHTL